MKTASSCAAHLSVGRWDLRSVAMGRWDLRARVFFGCCCCCFCCCFCCCCCCCRAMSHAAHLGVSFVQKPPARSQPELLSTLLLALALGPFPTLQTFPTWQALFMFTWDVRSMHLAHFFWCQVLEELLHIAFYGVCLLSEAEKVCVFLWQ